MRRQCFVHDDIYACGNACKYMYVRDTGADQQNSWQPRTRADPGINPFLEHQSMGAREG